MPPLYSVVPGGSLHDVSLYLVSLLACDLEVVAHSTGLSSVFYTEKSITSTQPPEHCTCMLYLHMDREYRARIWRSAVSAKRSAQMAVENLNQQTFQKLILLPRHDYIVLLAREVQEMLPYDSNWNSEAPPLLKFISNVVSSSCVPLSTLLATPVYLKRLRSKIPPNPLANSSTGHRIVFSCLILAAKYLNDVTPKNSHWSWWSYMVWGNKYFGFSQSEVDLMERQLIRMLDWDLRITDFDIYDAFKAPLLLCRAITENNRQNSKALVGETFMDSLICPCRICQAEVATY